MKRAVVICAIAVGTCLFSACPPQNPQGTDICPGFAHCALLAWHGNADEVFRGPADCLGMVPISNIQLGVSTFIDVTVQTKQAYCYQVANSGELSNKVKVTIP